MRSALESHGRLFDPDAFADGDGRQRTYCDMELARLYGPLDECYRSRVSALLENADDEQLGTSERLQATGLLLCIYREYRALDSARYLVGTRQAEVLADPNSRDLYFDTEAQAWHDTIFGMQYMNVLDRGVIDAYIDVELVNGKDSTQMHAARALNQLCHIFRKIQPRRLSASGGIKREQVAQIAEETCTAFIKVFTETFAFTDDQVHDIVSGTGHQVLGVGQLTMGFASRK